MKHFIPLPFLASLAVVSGAMADSFVIEARPVDRARHSESKLTIPVVETEIQLDGRLDEPAWRSAAAIEQLREYPAKNPFPAEARFRLLADAEHVYLGFDLKHQPGLTPRFKEPTGGDEYGGNLIEVFLDPGGEGKERFQFICNPLGMRYDSRDSDKKWDGGWKSAGEVREDGWSVEMAIPLSDLGRRQLLSLERWRANFGYVGPADLHLSWTGGWGAPETDYADIVFAKAGVETKPNLLPDPGFETAGESGLPEGWATASLPDNVLATADDSSPRSGKTGLHFELPQGGEGKGIIAYRMVGPGFDPGQTYTFSCYVRTKGIEGHAYLAAYQYPAPIGPDHRHKSKELKGDHDWTRLSLTFQAREDIGNFQLRCGVHSSNPAKGGEVWFDDAKLEVGDTATEFVPSAQPVLNVKKFTLWLDREIYDPRDTTAVGLLGLEADGIENTEELAVALSVIDEGSGEEANTDRIEPLPGFSTDLTLDIAQLKPGTYRVLAELVRKDGRVLKMAERSFEKRKRRVLAEGEASGRIPIRVPAESRADGVDWPISAGVPLLQGVLDDTQHARLLDPDGRAVPAQFSTRSTWNRGGSIQWLGVDFVPTLSGAEQEYVLEYGPDVGQQLPDSPMTVEETEERVRVTTGPLQFGRKAFQLVDSAFLDLDGDGQFEPDEQVVDATKSSGPALVDHEGNRYIAAADRDVEVEVEESGPIKTVIRATGWYVREGSDGARLSCELPTDRLCRFTFRITAWAGQADLQIASSTVITYDSDKVRLRDLSLGLGLPGVNQLRIGTGDADQRWSRQLLEASPHIVQHRPGAAFDQQGNELPPASGWVTATGETTVTHLAMRNLRKLFPKEIEWTDDSLLFHIWPAHAKERTFELSDELTAANIYKLWYAHQGRELDFRFPQAYFDKLDAELIRSPGAFGTYYKAMEYSNAQGLCLHNDFMIGFRAKDAQPGQADAEQLSSLLDNAVHAAPDPASACATGVFGPMLHADFEKFGAIEETTRDGFRSLAERTDPNDEYGQLIFGGRHTYWSYHLRPPHAGMHRVWINGHYNIGRFPFVQFVRTGDPAYLHWARNFTNNLRDIGMVHYASDERQFRYHTLGAMYHCKGFAPWAGDSHNAAHLISNDQLIYDFFITGNRRSRDAFLTWIEGLKQTDPGGNGTREGINTLAQLVEAYRFTWDAELLPIMDRYAEQIFVKQPLAEQHWWDYAPLLLPRYYGLTGSKTALNAYREVRETDRTIRSGRSAIRNGSHIDGYLALLDLDRDDASPEMLANSGLTNWQQLLHQRAVSCVRQGEIPHDGHTKHQWLEFIYPAHKLPYILKALDEFDLAIHRPTRTPDAPLPMNGNRSVVFVREAEDAAFPVQLRFVRVPKGPVTVSVVGSQGEVAAKNWTPPADAEDGPPGFELQVPADGRAEDYRIEITCQDAYAPALWPLTPLPHEAAILTKGQNRLFTSPLGTRLYFAPDDSTPSTIVISSNYKGAMGMEFLDEAEAVLHRVSDSRYVGSPQNVDLDSIGKVRSIYVSDEADISFKEDAQLMVSDSPERLFQPGGDQ